MSVVPAAAPFTIFIPSSNASPKMGGITIRKENCASLALLSPSNKPVEWYYPNGYPGNTAQA